MPLRRFGTSAGKTKTLKSIKDVNAPSPANNDSLTWDSTTEKWIPEAIAGGGNYYVTGASFVQSTEVLTLELTGTSDVDVTISGTSGGSPGGASGDIQYRKPGGTFGGISGFEFADDGNHNITLLNPYKFNISSSVYGGDNSADPGSFNQSFIWSGGFYLRNSNSELVLTKYAGAGNKIGVGCIPDVRLHVSGAEASLFKLGSGASVGQIFDEDNMASDSATGLVTQQSVKSYVEFPAGSGVSLHTASSPLIISGNRNTFNLSVTGATLQLVGDDTPGIEGVYFYGSGGIAYGRIYPRAGELTIMGQNNVGRIGITEDTGAGGVYVYEGDTTTLHLGASGGVSCQIHPLATAPTETGSLNNFGIYGSYGGKVTELISGSVGDFITVLSGTNDCTVELPTIALNTMGRIMYVQVRDASLGGGRTVTFERPDAGAYINDVQDDLIIDLNYHYLFTIIGTTPGRYYISAASLEGTTP